MKIVPVLDSLTWVIFSGGMLYSFWEMNWLSDSSRFSNKKSAVGPVKMLGWLFMVVDG